MVENPGIKVTEVVKQIAKQWQALSKEEKGHYKDVAKRGNLINILHFPKLILMILKIDKERYLKELQELSKSSKTLVKPKKPLTPYMLFVRSVRNIFSLKVLIYRQDPK